MLMNREKEFCEVLQDLEKISSRSSKGYKIKKTQFDQLKRKLNKNELQFVNHLLNQEELFMDIEGDYYILSADEFGRSLGRLKKRYALEVKGAVSIATLEDVETCRKLRNVIRKMRKCLEMAGSSNTYSTSELRNRFLDLDIEFHSLLVSRLDDEASCVLKLFFLYQRLFEMDNRIHVDEMADIYIEHKFIALLIWDGMLKKNGLSLPSKQERLIRESIYYHANRSYDRWIRSGSMEKNSIAVAIADRAKLEAKKLRKKLYGDN